MLCSSAILAVAALTSLPLGVAHAQKAPEEISEQQFLSRIDGALPELELHDAASWQRRSAQIGVDPFDESFGPLDLHALTRRSVTPIRNWLLDQRRIAGVGNIYASEALHRAGIHPARRARTLTRAEAAALLAELRTVLRAAIDARGTTMSDYLDAEGEAGDYWDQRLAYAREDEPCTRCGTPIRRVVISNRSAFFCPSCQPRSRRRVSGAS